jgi:1-deoxy-D-xylulose-5-phosphate synthase
METADLLEKQGVKAAVINPRWIKPLDAGTLEFFARGSRVLCTLEDHAVSGGFGAAVAEHLSDAGITTPLVRVGWPDQFIEHGSVTILREKYGMTAQAAAERIIQSLNLVDRKTKALL